MRKTEKENEKEENLNVFVNLKLKIEEAYAGTTKTIKQNGIEYNLEIPAKTPNKKHIVIKNQGKRSKDNYTLPGDLIFVIDIQDDEEYTLKGLDIIKKVKIFPSQAVLGSKVGTKILNEELSIIVPPFTENGKKITLKNQGLRSNTGVKGDLILEIAIEVPRKLSDEQKELYIKLKEIEERK